MWRGWHSRSANAFLGRSSTQLFESSAIITPVGARNLGNLKELRTRIAAIKSIKKITSTMKLVAASKLNKAQKRLDDTKPYASTGLRFLESEFPVPPLNEENKEAEMNEFQIETLQKLPGTHLIVALTSDRGLCGGVNSSVVRTVKKLATIHPRTELILLGDKATAGLTKEFADNFVATVSDISGNTPTSYTDIAQIADLIMKQDFSRLTVVHNSFISILAFATRRRVFPSREAVKEKKRFPNFEFDDSREEDLDDYYSFSFCSFLYAAIFESHACELGARMSSMDNATTNAADVLNKLSIKYNKQRQAAITTELTEIVSGAAAIEAMESKD